MASDSAANPDIESRLELAVEAAQAAGAETLKWFRRQSLAVERKQDGSPVTAADRASETLLRERIRAAFPHDAILGEEFGEQPGTSGYQWVLDPIDGTKSFIAGVPLYTTLVAVMHNNESRLGVIYAPATGELVYAAAGQPAWYSISRGERMQARVSDVERLADATFLTSEINLFDRAGKAGRREIFYALEKACRVTRTWGDAYGYLLVATGRADVMIDADMNLWDAAALQPIIEGAGGRFLDWQGRPTVHTRQTIATNPRLAGLVLSITRES
jgi:histidinol phosphatase-like enzyme (inositol monophosphatase family)